jgi:hypothetical protein
VVLSKGVRDVRLDKLKSREKIDAAAAACCAVDVFLAYEQVTATPYSGRGMTTLEYKL